MSTTTQPTVFSCQWKIIRILTHSLLDLRFFHVWRSLYNLFVLLILSASFTLASVILQVQHFYILSLPRCSDGFYNVLSDEDGWWIRTTFIDSLPQRCIFLVISLTTTAFLLILEPVMHNKIRSVAVTHRNISVPMISHMTNTQCLKRTFR